MATTILDHPGIPCVRVRFDGEIGEPLVVIPAAILKPADAVQYAQKIFASAGAACQRSGADVAGNA
jgi:hypothetical protein